MLTVPNDLFLTTEAEYRRAQLRAAWGQGIHHVTPEPQPRPRDGHWVSGYVHPAR